MNKIFILFLLLTLYGCGSNSEDLLKSEAKQFFEKFSFKQCDGFLAVQSRGGTISLAKDLSIDDIEYPIEYQNYGEAYKLNNGYYGVANIGIEYPNGTLLRYISHGFKNNGFSINQWYQCDGDCKPYGISYTMVKTGKDTWEKVIPAKNRSVYILDEGGLESVIENDFSKMKKIDFFKNNICNAIESRGGISNIEAGWHKF